MKNLLLVVLVILMAGCQSQSNSAEDISAAPLVVATATPSPSPGPSASPSPSPTCAVIQQGSDEAFDGVPTDGGIATYSSTLYSAQDTDYPTQDTVVMNAQISYFDSTYSPDDAMAFYMNENVSGQYMSKVQFVASFRYLSISSTLTCNYDVNGNLAIDTSQYCPPTITITASTCPGSSVSITGDFDNVYPYISGYTSSNTQTLSINWILTQSGQL